MKISSAVIFLLLFPFFITAQSFQPHSINYSVEEGLPSSECYEVMQDSKGLIWVATDKGICKFNGYTFTKYTTEDGLPDNTIFGFFEDHKKRLWGRTLSGGLFYFENDRIHIPEFNESLKKAISTAVISDISVNTNDSIYIETKDLALHIGSFGSKEIRTVSQPKNIMRFLNKKAIVFWQAHQYYNMKDLRHMEIIYKNRLVHIDDRDCHIAAIGQKKQTKNGFMLNCDNKLLYYDEHSDKSLISTFRNRILSIYEDRSLGIWVGTLNDGLYYYKYGISESVKHFLQDESITSLCEDTEGGMWITTLKSGVYYIPNKHNLSIEFSKEAFNVIKPTGNEMAGGSKNGNVYFFDSIGVKDMVNISPSLTKGNSVYELSEIDETSILSAGIYCFLINKKDHSTSPFSMNIKSFPSPSLYSRGIALNTAKDTLYTFSAAIIVKTALKDRSISKEFVFTKIRLICMHCTAQNQLYLGTGSGLYEFRNGRYINLAKSRLLQARINDITSWGDKLLLATNGDGVLFVDLKNNTVKQLAEAEGLSSNLCQKITVHQNTAWISTNKGISVVDINNEGFGKRVRRIDKYDGLPGEEINYIWVDSTNVWIASNSGISYFSKNLDLVNKISPPIYLDFLKTNKGTYKDPEKKLIFNYDENYIEINFYGLSYKSFRNLKYKYKLSGIDESWHYTNDPKIIYPALSSGSYSFEVYAINSDGISSAHSAVLHFDVTPPFWKKWWFIAGVLLLILLLVILFFKYRINMVKEQELKNADLHKTFLNLKLKALRAQMNPHFTFNVMNSIQHFILTKDEESAHRYMSKFSKLIRAILNNSEKNTIPVAEEIKALELYLELEAMRFDKNFSYEIIIDPMIDPEIIRIPSMLIQPYIENAIKHGILPLKENGKLKLEIALQGNLLKCIIEDNGIGRAKAAEQNKNRQHQSLGISLTTERLIVINELNNSNLSEKIIDLTDKNGNALGTRVEIYIPIN